MNIVTKQNNSNYLKKKARCTLWLENVACIHWTEENIFEIFQKMWECKIYKLH